MAMLIYQRVITMLKFHTVFQGGEISHQNETNISYQHVYIIKIYLYIYILKKQISPILSNTRTPESLLKTNHQKFQLSKMQVLNL